MKVGIKNEISTLVTEELLAVSVKSGVLPVYATPALAALMEQAAAESVEEFLEAGAATVGTRLELDHLAATPAGMTVRCESELIALDGRKLTFSIKAYDESGLIGKAIHERFIVDSERFLKKTYEKIKK